MEKNTRSPWKELADRIGQRIHTEKGEKQDVPTLKKVVKLALVLAAVLIVTNPASVWFLPAGLKNTLSDIWSSLFGNVDAVTQTLHINWATLFQIIVIVLFLTLISNLARLVMDKLHPKSGKAQSILSMAESFLSYVVFLVGLIWCLSVIGIDLGTIFASLGVMALIVGFAAESLIADIITGFFLVFEDEFNVGDVIEYGGFRGTVTGIGIRITSIQDASGNIKLVNNSDLRNILNRSKAASRAVCDIPVSYSADLAEVELVLEKILKSLPEKYPDSFPSGAEYLGVQSLSASSVDLRVCATVREADLYKAIRLINREVKLGFDKAGVEIPFQQVVVHQAEK